MTMAYMHGPQRVQVAVLAGPFSLGLFGRHVLGGADDSAGHGQAIAGEDLGDAEIGQLDDSLGSDQQVGGLQVAVNDAGVVGGFQAPGRSGWRFRAPFARGAAFRGASPP